MRVTINVNRKTLREAALELGTTSIDETVQAALLEVVERRARRAALEAALLAGRDLGDPEVMRGAWRD